MTRGAFPIDDTGNELVQYNFQSSYAAYVGKGKLSYNPDYLYPSHWHQDLELSVVLNGQMDYNIDGVIETIHEGEGIFINSQHVHSNYSPNKTDCEYICVLANPIVLCVQPGIDERYLNPLLKNAALSYIHLLPEIDWHAQILKELREALEDQTDPAAPLLFQAHLCRIWANLYRHTENTEQSPSESDDLLSIKAMISFIQKNYQRKITLKDIAASGANGQSKCCQLFKRYLHQTPVDYLALYRLDQSRNLLLDGKKNIAEIAEAVGYRGASYFTESFRKRFGMTPSSYVAKYYKQSSGQSQSASLQ